MFAQELGHPISSEDVLITPGAQPALITCFRSLTKPGDTLLVESPTYPGALTAARSAEVVALGIPADEHGMRTDHLEQALLQTRSKVIYAQPRWLNPSGSRLSVERRNEIYELLNEHSAFLIEDDCSRDLELGVTPHAPMVNNDNDGHIIYVRSLTRHSGPGLRIATIVARGVAMTRLRTTRRSEGFFVAALLQLIACEVLTSPSWERHLRKVRNELTGRRNVLANEIARVMPTWTLGVIPTTGVHLWYRLPDGKSEADTVVNLAAMGVSVEPGAPHFPAEPTGAYIRLSYGGSTQDQLREAVARMINIR